MIIKDQLNRAYSPDMESAEKDKSKQSQTVSSIPAGGSTGQVLAKALGETQTSYITVIYDIKK